MTDLSALVPNELYIVARNEDQEYLVLQGFEASVPSAVHWSEFSPVQ